MKNFYSNTKLVINNNNTDIEKLSNKQTLEKVVIVCIGLQKSE